MMDSSDNKTLIVSNDVFKFLEKYGFTVISLEENEDLIKQVETVKKLILGLVKYLNNKTDCEHK